MSERFSDEVLQRVHEAGERAYIGIKHELLDDWQAIDAARFAAMRAVLEGHLTQEIHHEQCPWALADVLRVRSVCGCPEGWPKASDGLRHDSIKPTSGRLLSAKKVKKASDGSPR